MSTSTNATVSRDRKTSNDELDVSCRQSVVLHESENAWRPSYKREYSLDEKQQLQRCVQGVLNKLTFQKFKILLTKIDNLKFNKLENLDLIINLIYENAVYEPQFSILYANLCKELNLVQLSITDSTGNQQNFHDHLVTKCLNEFENWCVKYKLENNVTVIGDNKKEKAMFDEEKRKTKCRQIGITRFIGELFNFTIITPPIICECIEKLLALQHEEALELFCQLLKTVGKVLDENNIEINMEACCGNSMDLYFAQIQTIVEQHLTSTRIRFMLEDIIDLRKNNWIPRRRENIPKTIDEIHQEFQLEINENSGLFGSEQMVSSKYRNV